MSAQSAYFLGRGNVPNANGPIGASGKHRFAVTGKVKTIHMSLVTAELPDFFAGTDVPPMNHAIRTSY
jgi:hypothetical protein